MEIYNSYVSEFKALCDRNIELYNDSRKKYIYEFTSDALEISLEDLSNRLLTDVQVKTEIGNEIIAKELDDEYNPRMVRITYLYCKYLRHTVGDYDDNKTI